MPTRILGIESSCDETAAAVVADGRDILSSVVASQMDIHRKYGGVVPELASREHLRQIVPVVREALAQAGLSFSDIDAIGVTQGPGLIGSLLVGMTYGKVLALELGKPLVPVNHLEGHVHAVFLEAHIERRMPELPAVCLIVSGGHTLLYYVEAKPGAGSTLSPPEKGAGSTLSPSEKGAGSTLSLPKKNPGSAFTLNASSEASSPRIDGSQASCGFQFRRLGGTRDDAAGEAYDKVARLLALGYPGGPVIDQLATRATACGPAVSGAGSTFTLNASSEAWSSPETGAGSTWSPPETGAGSTWSPPEKDELRFGRVKIKGNPYDFSFSGIKTAVLYYLRAHPEFNAEIEARREALLQGRRKAADLLPLCSPQVLTLISNFQSAVVKDLVTRSLAAADETGAHTILVSGGVAANSALRENFESKAATKGVNVFFPSRALSTDNAAMIAAAAYSHLQAGDIASSDLNAEPNLRIA
jgi:N6-L-threonylcarbamoyladenine synthase